MESDAHPANGVIAFVRRTSAPLIGSIGIVIHPRASSLAIAFNLQIPKETGHFAELHAQSGFTWNSCGYC